jgi:hypothetical protein
MSNLTVQQLKDILAIIKAPTSGNKTALLNRVKEFIIGNNESIIQIIFTPMLLQYSEDEQKPINLSVDVVAKIAKWYNRIVVPDVKLVSDFKITDVTSNQKHVVITFSGENLATINKKTVQDRLNGKKVNLASLDDRFVDTVRLMLDPDDDGNNPLEINGYEYNVSASDKYSLLVR